MRQPPALRSATAPACASLHVGRAGWTWYTGSSGWMLRVALESVIGLEVDCGHTLRLRPRIPSAWPGYSLSYRIPGSQTRYEIEVRREGDRREGEGREGDRSEGDRREGNGDEGEARISGRLDDGTDLVVDDAAVVIPLVADDGVHRVSVSIG